MSNWKPSAKREALKGAAGGSSIIERMSFKTPSAYLRAVETVVNGVRKYEIYAGRINPIGEHYETAHEVYCDRDEANAMWKTLKRNYFVNDAF